MSPTTFILLAFITFFTISTNAQFQNYNQLYRTFGVFKDMPLNTTAASSDWTQFTSCDPRFGIGYTTTGTIPSKYSPAYLLFTSAGQIAGFGVRVFSSHVPIDLVPTWWMPVSGLTDVYDLIISFRDQTYMCSGKVSSLVLGDRLVINNYYRMPETGRAASGLNWNAGACIPEMGIHYSYDVSTNGPMSWNASTLLPVMPMFGVNDDQIKAVLIATPTFQTVEPFGEFEGPFINPLMCLNWCEDTGCTFAGTTFWTTMHWLFTDYHDVSCTGAKCSV